METKLDTRIKWNKMLKKEIEKKIKKTLKEKQVIIRKWRPKLIQIQTDNIHLTFGRASEKSEAMREKRWRKRKKSIKACRTCAALR